MSHQRATANALAAQTARVTITARTRFMPADDNGPMADPVSKLGAAALTDWGVIGVSGPDAATFLQSQLSSDVSTLSERDARLAGYCSAKGRLLASFVVWKGGEEFLLACSADLLAPTLKRLSMFVLRARCKLSDCTADVRLSGLCGSSARSWLGNAAPDSVWRCAQRESATVLRLPDARGEPRYLWVTPATLPSPALMPISLAEWRWLEVQSGVPFIVAATADRFVPQMLNYELLGGVDFQKGCYPGQEVVARSQYRGTIKRRCFLFDTDVLAQPGQEVFHSIDPLQPAGMVANAAAHPQGGGSALVELKLAALNGGTLHLGQASGSTLSRRALPYPVPA